MDAAQKTPGMGITSNSTKTVGKGWFGTSVGAPKENVKTTVPSSATQQGPKPPPVPKRGFAMPPAALEAARQPKDFHQLSQHAFNLGAMAHDTNTHADHQKAHDAHYATAKAWQGLGTPEATEHAVKHVVAAAVHSKAMKGIPQ